MTIPSSVQTKVDRAQEHFDSLRNEIRAFGERQPYRVVREHNADFTEHTLSLAFDEPVPVERWGAMLGDGIQSLRSALDHLVYAIAIHESGQDPPPEDRRLMFPITNGQPLGRAPSRGYAR